MFFQLLNYTTFGVNGERQASRAGRSALTRRRVHRRALPAGRNANAFFNTDSRRVAVGQDSFTGYFWNETTAGRRTRGVTVSIKPLAAAHDFDRSAVLDLGHDGSVREIGQSTPHGCPAHLPAAATSFGIIDQRSSSR